MWWRLTLMDIEGGSSSRVAWADIAKAISIVLLVFWTTAGDQFYLNEMLILVRMPLFFFVSGLFAHRMITRTDLGDFLRNKIGNLLYLYALWIAILFLSINVVAYLVDGTPIDPMRQMELFWDPLFTIWFLYALAVAFLVTRLVRGIPLSVVFAGALLLYLASVASGDWRYLSFLERIVRLYPFFLLGLVVMPLADRVVGRFYLFWPLVGGLYLALAYAVFDSPLNDVGLLTFTITLTGILATLLFARHLSKFSWSWPLTVIGASTLYIYVTHKVVLFYLNRGLDALAIDLPGASALVVIPVVVICTLFGRWAQRTPWAAWLYAAPWCLARRKDGAPAYAGAVRTPNRVGMSARGSSGRERKRNA